MADIIVGVDGSQNSLAALRWAHAEARLHGSHLVALFAWGYIQPEHAGSGPTFDPALDAAYDAGGAEALLDAAVEAALGSDGRTVERRVTHDLATRALLSAATGTELLVVGARGAGGIRGLFVGSVSSQLLHHASGPLAIVRLPAADQHRDLGAGRIVVGFDDSPSARRALHWAVDEARVRGARLDVVRAWTIAYPYPALVPVGGYPVSLDAGEATARAGLDRALAGLELERRPVTGRVVHGPAGPAILDAAHDADLVVLGTRGHGAAVGTVLGSVTRHVAHHATVPVVVVP